MKEDNNKKKKTKKKRKIKKGHIKKKLKTLYKQKVIRDFVVLFLIQIIIICFFCFLYFDTVDVSNAKTIEITVERIDYRLIPLVRNLLCVYSDSDEYVFPRNSTFQEYGNAKLEKAIHIGDKLELTYVEMNWRFNEINYIVDARSGNEIYRNIETYTEPNLISRIFWWAVPIVIEVIYLAIVFLFIWIHKEKLDFRK